MQEQLLRTLHIAIKLYQEAYVFIVNFLLHYSHCNVTSVLCLALLEIFYSGGLYEPLLL